MTSGRPWQFLEIYIYTALTGPIEAIWRSGHGAKTRIGGRLVVGEEGGGGREGGRRVGGRRASEAAIANSCCTRPMQQPLTPSQR